MTTISNPADKLKIKKMMGEISNSYTRIEAERDLIKDTIDALSKEYEMEKKQLRKMSRIFHKQNYSKVEAEQEDFYIFILDLLWLLE